MIFVTVGSSEPFDRLVSAIDEWAGAQGRSDVFAQIGRSSYVPRHIEAVPFLQPAEFRERVRAARVVVAHAGMGSIITALEIGKPIVVMPRREHLKETRSDHQLATARQFEQKQSIIVAVDEIDLIVKLEREEALPPVTKIQREASPALISAIRAFILESNGNGSSQAK